MAFQLSVTDPATGSVYPSAVTVITDAVVQLSNNAAELTLSTYATADTVAAGLQPVLPTRSVVLTPAEINLLRAQFSAVLYSILRGRAEWHDALDI